ncbi:MAG: ABC transporter permease [bacterium]
MPWRIVTPLTELWPYRRLIRQLAVRDLKARYKVSVLGFFWSLLRPLLTIAVLALVFSYIMGFESPRYAVPYYVLLLVTYIPWFYFSTALLEGTQSILANSHLIKKVYCPRAVYPAAVVLANGVNFVFSLVVLIPLVYILSGSAPSWTLLQLPLVIGFHTALILGLCLAVSVMNILFRDTTQMMEFLVFVWFYLSPVLYDVYEVYQRVEGGWRWLYFLNPMAGILEWYRYVLLASQLRVENAAFPGLAELRQVVFYGAIPYAAVVSVIVLFAGYAILKRLETRAVDAL